MKKKLMLFGVLALAGTAGHYVTSMFLEKVPGISKVPENWKPSVSYGVAFGVTMTVANMLKK